MAGCIKKTWMSWWQSALEEAHWSASLYILDKTLLQYADTATVEAQTQKFSKSKTLLVPFHMRQPRVRMHYAESLAWATCPNDSPRHMRTWQIESWSGSSLGMWSFVPSPTLENNLSRFAARLEQASSSLASLVIKIACRCSLITLHGGSHQHHWVE